ncbi:unnamed protein product [Haemonchus placei]|uniref:MFS domain-containing protein n=1 Tax=Haemonchus placei TaxID=6290 RepID=A0A158QJS9_HAEPC|nr:unnamed protein product [Haemonchus placei]
MLSPPTRTYFVRRSCDDEESNEMLDRRDDTSTDETTSMEKTEKVKTDGTPYYPLFSLKSTRLRISLMLATGLFVTVSMRLDLSMAIVCMVNSTAFASHHAENESILNITTKSSKCRPLNYDYDSAIQAGYTGHLLWSPAMQSLLLSATFYGGLATISFAGVLADRYGPKNILIVVILDYIVVTLLTPLLSQWSFYVYFVSRLVMGIGEIAASLSSLISAYLCTLSFGWPSIFYLFGGLGCAYLVVFCLYVTNSPTTHKCISEDEKAYLAQQIQHTHAKVRIIVFNEEI